MEQQQQQQQMQVQPHLKCPRCDSSNTKFCYYNNYSLSQPRHLCKACKRYWTRGGTLRSVPVGGKCRKNKRVKQTTTTSSSIAQDPIFAAAKPSTTVKSSQVDLSSSTTKTHIVNPLYSKRDGKDLSFPQFSKTGTDLLGFLKSQNLSQNLNPGDDTNVAVSNQVFSGYPFYGVSSTSTTSTMASSIIPSSLEQQNQLVFNGFKESAEHPPYGFLGPDDVHQWLTRNGGGNQLVKDAKMEGNGNRFDWKTNGNHIYIEAMNFTSDPPFMWSSSAPWLDSTDNGSSVPFLI